MSLNGSVLKQNWDFFIKTRHNAGVEKKQTAGLQEVDCLGAKNNINNINNDKCCVTLSWCAVGFPTVHYPKEVMRGRGQLNL